MLKSVSNDLDDIRNALAHLALMLDKLDRCGTVDVGARVRSALNTIKKIDEVISQEIKAWRKNEPGMVMGEAFMASLLVFPVSRLDVQTLKIDQPKIYAKFLKKDLQRSVLYGAR